MTRHCEYTPCGKELVPHPKERPGRFEQRHFCDGSCRNRFVSAKKKGMTYAPRKAKAAHHLSKSK